MKVLLASFVLLLATAASAQPDLKPAAGMDLRSAQAELQKPDTVPAGGCMPIGLTARGDLVFPMQCREVIERERGPLPEQQPQATEQRSPQEPPKIAPAEKVDIAATGLTPERPRKRLSRAERQKLRELRPTSDPVVTGSTKPVVTGSTKPVVTGSTRPVVTGSARPVVTGSTRPNN
jgi:hypothetical protein